MDKRCIAEEALSPTGFSYMLSLINGKYSVFGQSINFHQIAASEGVADTVQS